MAKKNLRLLIVIVVLLAANLLLFIDSDFKSGISYDEAMFAVEDTARLETIELGSLKLSRSGQNWRVNDFKADPSIAEHLLSILNRVRVKKPVGAMDAENATEVKLNGESVFQVKSNDTKTKTFFIKEGEGYEVEIPGFSDYLGGVFELHPDQWRDRLLLDGSWRTIQYLEIAYHPDSLEDIRIRYQDNFFSVAGISDLDSTAVVEYLNQFKYFQANEYVSRGRFPNLDSLANTRPLATLRVDDINHSDTISFRIFPRIRREGDHLITDEDQDMYVIDYQRMRRILAQKRPFSAAK